MKNKFALPGSVTEMLRLLKTIAGKQIFSFFPEIATAKLTLMVKGFPPADLQ
jgi:hypothetical protein